MDATITEHNRICFKAASTHLICRSHYILMQHQNIPIKHKQQACRTQQDLLQSSHYILDLQQPLYTYVALKDSNTLEANCKIRSKTKTLPSDVLQTGIQNTTGSTSKQPRLSNIDGSGVVIKQQITAPSILPQVKLLLYYIGAGRIL